MIDPAILDAMVATGCTAEQIASVVKAAMQAGEAGRVEKRAKNADRQRRHRERNAVSRVTGVTNGDNLSPKERSPIPPKEITPIPVSEPDGSSTEARAFDQFWTIFPNKVGKRDAEKAFAKAVKRASLEAILAGVRRYAAKTDDRPWCNPATFLNQDRWGDQPAAAPQQRSASPPNRKPNAFDAYDQIARERGWTTDEPEFLPRDHRDDPFLPKADSGHQGTVVDLRPSSFRRVGSGGQ